MLFELTFIEIFPLCAIYVALHTVILSVTGTIPLTLSRFDTTWVRNFAANLPRGSTSIKETKNNGGQNFWGQDDKGKGNLQDFEAG